MDKYQKAEQEYWFEEFNTVPGWPAYKVNRIGQVWSSYSERLLKFGSKYTLYDKENNKSAKFYKDRLVYLAFTDVIYELTDYNEDGGPIYGIVFINVPDFKGLSREYRAKLAADLDELTKI